MSKLRLNMALRYYDRTAALIDGTVQPEGIELNYVQLKPWETFWRVLHHSEFDVTEISTSGYLTTRERIPKPYIAIPVSPPKFSGMRTSTSMRAQGSASLKTLKEKRSADQSIHRPLQFGHGESCRMSMALI